MDSTLEPKLAPPGAGLPAAELMIARLLFKWRLHSGTRESFNQHFTRERQTIANIMRTTNPDLASRRVLIDRLRGLEDSSRFWSIWMTLDHLQIVHNRIASLVTDLAKGVTPPGKVRTADVKPDPNVTTTIVADYEKSCDTLVNAFAAIPDLKTPLRFTHPWFGPLDAFGWQGLAAGHLAIHREQIQRISATF